MGDAQVVDQNAVWSRYLKDRESIWRVFRDFRDREYPLTLRFESVETLYTARVRDVDHRRVVLHGLHPRSGEVLMQAGRTFSIAGRSDGAYVYAPRNQALVAPAATDAAAAFTIDLPAELLWQQRRRGPRFTLPAALRGGRARITLADTGQSATGSIEDLSASGCRAIFEPSAHQLLEKRSSFDRGRLEIAGLLSIDVRVAVRHRTIDPAAGAVACGLEFTRMGADDRARLEQFLRNLARRASNG